MRKIVITTTKERNVPAEELYALRKEAFAQWKEKGLSTTAVDASVASFALVTHLCKTRTGKLNTLGRLAKRLRR